MLRMYLPALIVFENSNLLDLVQPGFWVWGLIISRELMSRLAADDSFLEETFPKRKRCFLQEKNKYKTIHFKDLWLLVTVIFFFLIPSVLDLIKEIKYFPFFPPTHRSKDYSALPAKRLWHFLVKQELLQDIFIRYTFTKKRKQSEVSERNPSVKFCFSSDVLCYSYLYQFLLIYILFRPYIPLYFGT